MGSVELAPTPKIKDFLEDNMPYSLALKAEFNFSSKLSLLLGARIKRLSSQCVYIGDEVMENGGGGCTLAIDAGEKMFAFG